jgi:hypothetical protein
MEQVYDPPLHPRKLMEAVEYVVLIIIIIIIIIIIQGLIRAVSPQL